MASCICPGAGYVTPGLSMVVGAIGGPWCYLCVAAAQLAVSIQKNEVVCIWHDANSEYRNHS